MQKESCNLIKKLLSYSAFSGNFWFGGGGFPTVALLVALVG
jgi:hypothetical protein